MEGQEKKPKLSRKKIAAGIGLLVLIILTIVILTNRDRLTFAHISRAIQYRALGTASLAEEVHFSNPGSNTLAILGDGLAEVSGSGLNVYDRGGVQVYTTAVPLARPVLETAGNFVLAFDHGGHHIQVGNTREALWHREWDEGRLIDARINENGWVTVSAERIGTLGRIIVVDPEGNDRFRVNIGTGHLITSALAPDNRTLVTLTMTETGGRIAWFYTDRGGDEPAYEYIEPDEFFFDFWFTSSDGAVGAISGNMVRFLSSRGAPQSVYQFSDRHLRNYDVSDGNVALYLATHPTGAGGVLVGVEPNGSVSETWISGNLFDISLSGRYLAALFLDELVVYRGGNVYARWDETEGMQHVLMREDGTVFRLSPHRARLLVP